VIASPEWAAQPGLSPATITALERSWRIPGAAHAVRVGALIKLVSSERSGGVLKVQTAALTRLLQRPCTQVQAPDSGRERHCLGGEGESLSAYGEHAPRRALPPGGGENALLLT
jgi:hypothetical protein